MDEKIDVAVDGIFRTFAKSDITLVELFNDRTALVVVNDAAKQYEGLVSPKSARKLEGYAAKERSTRFLVDAVAEEEVESDFRLVVGNREKWKAFNESKMQQARKKVPPQS